MSQFEPQLSRWESAGLIDAANAARIRAFEAEQAKPGGLQWQAIVALVLGGMLLAAGVVLFVNAHWDQIAPLARFVLVLGMVALFHLSGALVRSRSAALSTTLHAVGTLSVGAAIALVGQIFNIEEHWPAAILMWAVAAACGWALLRDQAQQVLAVLLFPAWLFSEWSYSVGRHQGGQVYLARMIAVWATLYLTFWLTSRRKLVWGICFSFAAIALVVANELLLEGWVWSWNTLSFLTLGERVWGWLLVAVLPLALALLRPRLSLLPVATALLLTFVIPFCQTQASIPSWIGSGSSLESVPNLLAHSIAAAFAAFLAWWGVRHTSKALVNYGIVAFAISIIWFFFADIFSKMGRSVGLITLGILFVAGGWALEKTRRRLIARMAPRMGQVLTGTEAK